jgi:hypothetical protein
MKTPLDDRKGKINRSCCVCKQPITEHQDIVRATGARKPGFMHLCCYTMDAKQIAEVMRVRQARTGGFKAKKRTDEAT